MKNLIIALLLFSIVLVSGCTNTNTYTSEGVVINMEATPSGVLENSNTLVYVDVDNKDIKTMNRVFIDIYDYGNFEAVKDSSGSIKLEKTVPEEGTGERKCSGGTSPGQCNAEEPLYCDSKGCSWNRCDICGCSSGDCLSTGDCGKLNPCSKFLTDMDVGDVQTLECQLKAKLVPYTPYQTKVSARVRYETNLSVVQTIDMMTESWYQSHELAGTLQRRPKSYSYNDKNLQLDLEFSDEMPIIKRSGKESFVTFKLRNIGNGFIFGIRSADLKIIQNQEILKSCKIDSCGLIPIGKDFPAFTCELSFPENINYLNNYIIIINIKYAYEVREEIPIEIIR